jgi:hypothetical protein
MPAAKNFAVVQVATGTAIRITDGKEGEV